MLIAMLLFRYVGFPKLRADLFRQDGPNVHLKPQSSPAPPRSPAVTRTIHERDLCTVVRHKLY